MQRMQAPTLNQPVLRYRGGYESQVYLLNAIEDAVPRQPKLSPWGLMTICLLVLVARAASRHYPSLSIPLLSMASLYYTKYNLLHSVVAVHPGHSASPSVPYTHPTGQYS